MPRHVVRWKWKYVPKNVRAWVSRDCFTVLWVDRGGRVYGGCHSRFLRGDAQSQKAELMARIWEGPMKRKSLEKMVGVRVHASPSGLVDTHPNVAEFMTAATFETDGKVELRESPTITTWCAGGQWKASIKDRAEGLVMWLSAESWAELWQMVDLFVMEQDAPWRHDEGALNGKRVKK